MQESDLSQKADVAKSHSSYGLVAIATIFAVALAFHLNVPVNHDAAWLLEGAKRLFEGGTFGRDFIDVSPPLAVWVDLPAVMFSELTGTYLGTVFKIYVALLATVSLYLSWTALAFFDVSKGLRTQFVLVLSAICLVIVGYDFGQREHLMLILTLPYVILAAARASNTKISKRITILSSLLAVFGFCLKPYFLAIPFMLELWLLSHHRDVRKVFRTETVLLGTGCIVYLAAIFVFAGDYLFYVMPRAMLNYSAYSEPFRVVLTNNLTILTPKILAITLLLVFAPKIASRNQITVAFVIAGTGAFVSAILQSKGWPYHLLPVTGFLAAGGAFIVLTSLQDRKPKSLFTVYAAGILLTITAVKPAIDQFQDFVLADGNAATVSKVVELLERLESPKNSIFAFITSPRIVHPAILQTDVNWISTACCLHFLPAAVRDSADNSKNQETALRRREIAEKQVEDILSNFEREKPEIVIVDDAKNKLAFGETEFDYIEWFLKNEASRFKKIWANYTEQNRIGRYRIFRRK